MEIQPIEQMSLWGRLRAGEFDAAFMIVQGGAHWYKNFFGAESPLGYENLEVEQLTIRALATADKRIASIVDSWRSFKSTSRLRT